VLVVFDADLGNGVNLTNKCSDFGGSPLANMASLVE
jgi:hypothetical protein